MFQRTNRASAYGFFVLVGASLAAFSCSLVVGGGDVQCDNNGDCKALAESNAAFAGAICSQDKVCIVPGGTGGNTGGSGGAGGSQTGCVTNSECVDQFGGPYICNAGTCVALLTEACPQVYGKYDSENPLVFGLLVPTTGSLGFLLDGYGKTVQLAIDEFDEFQGGVPTGPNGQKQQLVAVACNTAVDAAESARFLVEDVGVSALIGPLTSGNVLDVANNVSIQNGVILIAPTAATPVLATLDDDGLVWGVTDTDGAETLAIRLMIQEVEANVRADLGLAPTDPIKVAVVVRADAYGTAFQELLLPIMTFNGKTPVENGSDFLIRTYEDPTGTAVDYSAIVNDVISFEPHIVIPIGQQEASSEIMVPVEQNWSAPYRTQWVGGSSFDRPEMPEDVENNDIMNLSDRVRGARNVDFTGPVLDKFTLRYQGAYGVAPLVRAQMVYDATYMLGYATVAAGAVPKLSGQAIATGMTKLFSPRATKFEVGPTAIEPTLQQLLAGFSVDLDGASGPLDYDLAVGHPQYQVQVYCLGDDPLESVDAGQTYNPITDSLEGTYSCP